MYHKFSCTINLNNFIGYVSDVKNGKKSQTICWNILLKPSFNTGKLEDFIQHDFSLSPFKVLQNIYWYFKNDLYFLNPH